ncbi:hypothetical protein HA402_003868 [Bradysia odoriphaga]|nr:hypothetical protein HA402_003868 [Bradysia odoriphaga]
MSPCLSKPNSNLSAITYFAKCHPSDVCGINGLPLIPNSIAIFGRGQILKTIRHPNLCELLDIIRSKHERIIIVSEYSGRPLNECGGVGDKRTVRKIFYQIALALDHLNQNAFVCHNLEPANVLVDSESNVKLFNYGLFHMTNAGEYVPFPIGNVRYLPPERLLGSKNNFKSDVWSLGVIIAELVFGCTLWPTTNIAQTMRKILSLCNTKNVLEKIARDNNCLDKYQNLDPSLRRLLESCLTISTKERISTGDILSDLYFTDMDSVTTNSDEKPLLFECPLSHIYYWWQLAGGDVYTELKNEGLIRSEAPILIMPSLVPLSGKPICPPKSQSSLLDNRIVMLSLTNLIDRLSNIKPEAYFPLIHSPEFRINYGTEMENLPIVIRERDTEYQFHRVILFTRLLKGYPYTRDLIVKEAEKDIPPLLRGHIWACLLGVIENGSYESIDKVTPTATDRQIDVDIPRCHQYDESLSSPEGHRKLKRLLKAWVTHHPQYVYWQGLDSLTAPFLYLNFNNEERAFLSLYKFIPKYLHWFFLKDNSAIIKEYLSKFSQLTNFHEPVLAKHLRDINFIPELFAIPWFLTMFSHVFPLYKIIHLWDKLILGDNSFPLYIGISVLKQLKTTLLSSGFNECILLFSDLPDIVMETCVIESQKMYSTTPKSVTYRKHVLHEVEPDEFDVAGLELSDLQNELCPRISAKDTVRLLIESPERICIVDLRSSLEYKRAHIENSINIPFTSVALGDVRLESLNVPGLEKLLANRIVVVVSLLHENAILFSKFLIECGVYRVCTLHNCFNIFYSVVPNVLVSS